MKFNGKKVIPELKPSGEIWEQSQWLVLKLKDGDTVPGRCLKATRDYNGYKEGDIIYVDYQHNDISVNVKEWALLSELPIVEKAKKQTEKPVEKPVGGTTTPN